MWGRDGDDELAREGEKDESLGGVSQCYCRPQGVACALYHRPPPYARTCTLTPRACTGSSICIYTAPSPLPLSCPTPHSFRVPANGTLGSHYLGSAEKSAQAYTRTHTYNVCVHMYMQTYISMCMTLHIRTPYCHRSCCRLTKTKEGRETAAAADHRERARSEGTRARRGRAHLSSMPPL